MGNRVIEYYRQYGMKYFIKHSVKKIMRCEQRSYDRFRRHTEPSREELNRQKEKIFSFMPKISIVVPLYKTPEPYFRSMVESVCAQTYQNWELCLSDGSGKDSPLKELTEEYCRKDARIKVVTSSDRLNISRNTNQALRICTGDYIAFMDHDDLLSGEALFKVVEYLNADPDAELLYSDEDKVSADGKKFFQPHFKSDYNKDLLLSMNYICHLVVVKKTLLNQVGEIRSEYDGAQDYDFLLRCVSVTDKIVHIPKVLYHWRSHENSTARGLDKKDYASDAGERALRDYYQNQNIDAVVKKTKYPGIYRTKYRLLQKPEVTIIIPNKDHVEDLRKCLEAIREKAGYDHYEILIIENNSVQNETFLYYREIEKTCENIRVLYWEDKFNYAAINNWGAVHARGEYLLFLNNDIEWISKNFLREMLSVCQRDDVGIVGSLLYFPDHTVQHAGVVMGYSGIAGHAFIGQPRGQQGYFSRIVCMQDYSAVTAACMMVKKEVFQAVNGFDEMFEVAFNDVDLCLRVRETGKLVVYDPYTCAYHHESKTRGSDETPENKGRFEREKVLLRKRWKKYIIDGDPYYNRNLTLDRPDFSVREIR